MLSAFCVLEWKFRHSQPQAIARTSAANPTHRILLTGHSLGAAVATVAAAFLSKRYPNLPRLSVYTFGSPRVGDFGFSHNTFGKSVEDAWRVVHGGDVIAHEPPCCGFGGGCLKISTCPYHTKNEVWYPDRMPSTDLHQQNGNSTGFVLCQGAEDRTCDQFEGIDIADHLSYFGEQVAGSCCFESP
jgi:hypothetical protein